MEKRSIIERKDLVYWLIISVIFLIGSLTVNVQSNEQLIDRTNFASTIASIILAVIAIIYTFYQSITNTANEYKLNSSIDKIDNASNAITENITILTDSSKEITNLKHLVAELDERIGKKLDNHEKIFQRLLIDREHQNKANPKRHSSDKLSINLFDIFESNTFNSQFLHFLFHTKKMDIRGLIEQGLDNRSEAEKSLNMITLGQCMTLYSILKSTDSIKGNLKDDMFYIESFSPELQAYCEKKQFNTPIEGKDLFYI